MSSPFSITFGPDGHLCVSNIADNMLRFDGKNGGYLGVVADVVVPRGMTFGPDGKLYTTEGDDGVVAADRSSGAKGEICSVPRI